MAKDELKKNKKKKGKDKEKNKEKDKVKKEKKQTKAQKSEKADKGEKTDKTKKTSKIEKSPVTKKTIEPKKNKLVAETKAITSKYDFVLSASLEEYMEQIYLLDKEGKKVRVTDVARELGISKPSVNRAINSLADMGYVEHNNYGGIELTKKGKDIAKHIYSKHKALEVFLVETVGISEEKASKEAKNASHYFSLETVMKIIK